MPEIKSIDEAILAIVNQTEIAAPDVAHADDSSTAAVTPRLPSKDHTENTDGVEAKTNDEDYAMEDEEEEEEEKPKSSKRKNRDDDDDESDSEKSFVASEEEEDDDGAHDDEEFTGRPGTVLSVSRSGRKVIKPSLWAPTSSTIVQYDVTDTLRYTYIKGPAEDDEEEEDELLSETVEIVRKTPKTPKKPKTPLPYSEYLAKHLSSETIACQSFCSICADNSSVKSNRIVVCGLCEAPYHQQCHPNGIDSGIAEEAALPWFCYVCNPTEKAQAAITAAKDKLLKIIEKERVKEERLKSEALLLESMPSTPLDPNAPPPVKRKGPGRPRKNFKNMDQIKVKVENKMENKKLIVQSSYPRCISCGVVTGAAHQVESEGAADEVAKPVAPIDALADPMDATTDVFNMDAVETEKAAAPVAPVVQEAIIVKDPIVAGEVINVLLNKMCTPCHTLFAKQQDFLQMQTPEMLASLLVQTSVRFAQLSEFITEQSTREDAFNPQQLLAFSAKSRFINLPEGSIKTSTAKKTYLQMPQTPGTNTLSLLQETPSHAPMVGDASRRKTPHNYGSYEDMIARALQAHAGSRGLKPKEIFIWMDNNIPGLPENFRASATQALKKGVDRVRFIRVESGWYQMNAEYKERVKPTPQPRPDSLAPTQAQIEQQQMHIMQQQQSFHAQQQHQHQMAATQQQHMNANGQSSPQSQQETQDQERRHEHLQNYQIHQANAAAALASMQTQPQQNQYPQGYMMQTPQGLMPYPPSAAMAAAFAQQPYHGYPGFMHPQQHMHQEAYNGQYQGYSVNGEQQQAPAEVNENESENIFG